MIDIALSAEDLRARFLSLSRATDVADLLGVTYSKLTWHLWRSPGLHRYRRFEIKKRRGGVREITAPNGGVRLLQERLATVFGAVYQAGDSTHGFVRGKSIVTNARAHVGSKFVLNVDIEDFFPSVHFGRVRGLLMAWPYGRPASVATVLAQICFAGEKGLPQGAPTSPVVANMICARMDAAFSRLAQKHRCKYTRYSDDLTFSTHKPTFPRAFASVVGVDVVLGPTIGETLTDNGFRANEKKTKLRTRFDRQEVTGLVTNVSVNVPRRMIRQIRAMLHALEEFGEANAEQEFRTRWDSKHRNPDLPVSFLDVLAGKLTFLGMVRGKQDRLYSELVHRARKSHVRFGNIMTRDDAVIAIERSTEAVLRDNTPAQGTGFLAQGIGLVTAGHVACGPNGKPLTSMEAFRAHAPHSPVSVAWPFHDITLDFAVAPSPFRKLPEFQVGVPESVKRGDNVTVLGFPYWSKGQGVQEITARVIGKAPRFGADRIQLDLPIQQGMSGGPVLNDRGEVVGIAVTGSNDGSHPNAAVPITTLLERARQLGVSLPLVDE